VEHHEVFKKFKPYTGMGRKGYAINFLGTLTDVAHICPVSLVPRKLQDSDAETNERICIQTQYPEFREDYFEWISVLESVAQADKDYVAVELGAGIGPHLVNAAIAVKSYHGSIFPVKLVGVEGEPTTYTWMRKHFRDNGINPDDHLLIEAVASKQDGYILFEVGLPQGYGSYVVTPWHLILKPLKEVYRFIKRARKRIKGERCDARDYWTGKNGLGFYNKKTRSISLNAILTDLDKVDLIHLDIKGEEYRVLRAAVDQLCKKVKRVHIGTHNRYVERQLYRLFTGRKWKCVFNFPGNGKRLTPFGKIAFADGVQCWVNTQID